ncbi:MAG: TusE/DsrC/DsvC family sulfur relay protein [Porticoccaceae bacterium]|jgi:tRNA 2-thiouridine synthesizing protein E|tara:strand:- start:1036 stop:1338 length:303 start_codon:yes stop_codon:yes gene_type:complete
MTTETHYLSRLPDWGQAQASAIAVEENIVLTLAHMEVLEVARAFYDLYGFSPSMRPLCKAVATSLGVESGRSIVLNHQFPGSPARLIAKLAGLPKPKNCL